MSPGRRLACAALVGAAIAARARAPAGSGPDDGDEGSRAVRRLLVVGPGAQRRPILAQVGEVIQVCPFLLPVVPPFTDDDALKYEVKLEGDVVLREVGQRRTPAPTPGEGQSGFSVFFLVVGKGRVRVHLGLKVEGKPEPHYEHGYSVAATGRTG